MDAFLIKAIGSEIKRDFLEKSITRIAELEHEAVAITFGQRSKNNSILLSWHSEMARIHPTRHKWKQVGQEDHFVLQIRKYLSEARLRKVMVKPGERYITLSFQHFLNPQDIYNLTFLRFGSYANVLLWTEADQIVIDMATPLHAGWRKIEEILDNKKGQDIEHQSSLTTSKDTFLNLYDQRGEVTLDQFLVRSYPVIGRALARELVRTYFPEKEDHLDRESVWRLFQSTVSHYLNDDWSPVVRLEENSSSPVILLPFVPNQSSEYRIYNSFQAACDFCYGLHHKKYHLEVSRRKILKKYRNDLKKLLKTIRKVERERDEVSNTELFQQYGDLILSHLSQLAQGLEKISLPNLYSSEEQMIEIPLEAHLKPVENAQKYYHRASRLKRRKPLVLKRLRELTTQRQKLVTKIKQVEKADTLAELETGVKAISPKQRVQVTGKESKTKKQKKRGSSDHYHRFDSSDGWLIMVGKTDRENDSLTFNEGRSDDFWMHVRDGKGSHVLIKNPKRLPALPQNTLIEAALLAGHYSKFKKDSSIDVILTQKKYVRKAKKAPPGLVLVTREKNVRVQMGDKRLQELLKRKQ